MDELVNLIYVAGDDTATLIRLFVFMVSIDFVAVALSYVSRFK